MGSVWKRLGADVTINPQTGLISGVAPNGGDYVVCVCITEWRNGKAISTHRKDFIIRVDANCDFAAADRALRYGYAAALDRAVSVGREHRVRHAAAVHIRNRRAVVVKLAVNDADI